MSQNIVSLYDSHEKAVAAVNLLKDNGFNEKHISLLGKTDVGDDLQVKDANIAAKGVGVGSIGGPAYRCRTCSHTRYWRAVRPGRSGGGNCRF